MPAIKFRSVLLPDPLAPISDTKSPRPMSRSMSLRGVMVCSPLRYSLVTWRISTSAIGRLSLLSRSVLVGTPGRGLCPALQAIPPGRGTRWRGTHPGLFRGHAVAVPVSAAGPPGGNELVGWAQTLRDFHQIVTLPQPQFDRPKARKSCNLVGNPYVISTVSGFDQLAGNHEPKLLCAC